MQKKYFIIFELISPIIWFLLFIFWKVLIKNINFINALKEVSIMTFIFLFTLNIIITFIWKSNIKQ